MATELATTEPRAPIEVLKSVVSRKADDFKMVLPSHISVDKFQRTIATAALSNPKLLDCDRQSLLIAAMKLATDGLLPDGREAALVPFKSRVNIDGNWRDQWIVTPMPMAFGLRKKVLQSGEVVSLELGVVYEDEVDKNFIYEIGMDPPIRHRPNLLAKMEDRTDDKIAAAYSIAKIRNGDLPPVWSVEVMARHEIDKVRQMSQTGAVGRSDRSGKPIAPKGPWVDWFSEMAKKSVLRRHTKVLPMSGDILDAFDRDDAEEKRAEGMAALLESGGTPTLPTNEEFNNAALDHEEDSAEGEQVDAETGEVVVDDKKAVDNPTANGAITNSAPTQEEIAAQAEKERLEDEAHAAKARARQEAKAQAAADAKKAEEEAAAAAARELDSEAEADPRADDLATLEGMKAEFAGCNNDSQRIAVHEGYEQWISDVEGRFPDIHEQAMAAIPSYAEKDDAPASEQVVDQAEEAAKTVAEIDGPVEQQQDEVDPDSQDGRVRSIILQAKSGIAMAKTLASLNTVSKEIDKHFNILPDADAEEIDKLLSAKRREINAKK